MGKFFSLFEYYEFENRNTGKRSAFFPPARRVAGKLALRFAGARTAGCGETRPSLRWGSDNFSQKNLLFLKRGVGFG